MGLNLPLTATQVVNLLQGNIRLMDAIGIVSERSTGERCQPADRQGRKSSRIQPWRFVPALVPIAASCHANTGRQSSPPAGQTKFGRWFPSARRPLATKIFKGCPALVGCQRGDLPAADDCIQRAIHIGANQVAATNG